MYCSYQVTFNFNSDFANVFVMQNFLMVHVGEQKTKRCRNFPKILLLNSLIERSMKTPSFFLCRLICSTFSAPSLLSPLVRRQYPCSFEVSFLIFKRIAVFKSGPSDRVEYLDILINRSEGRALRNSCTQSSYIGLLS